MKKRLEGSEFRKMNEKLYKNNPNESFLHFQKNKKEYEKYHSIYKKQINDWPYNPLNRIIKFINTKFPANSVIADLGCGDARLAKEVKQKKVFSIDLNSSNKSVICCNIEKTPLDNESIDIVNFCLSLMGIEQTNMINEANRIMKIDGSLIITEILSRFDGYINIFVEKMKKHGFQLTDKKSDDWFIRFIFKKIETNNSKTVIKLKPCSSKKR
ncbi:hypothetical protein SNEBB_006233 [Seison nebaliae]|nr:hypothetical protein SNEBB_006233 [Seison nebaliae]